MKILHSAETLKGGTATMVRQLIHAQSAAGDTVQVVAPADQAPELAAPDCVAVRGYERRRRGAVDLGRLAVAFASEVLRFRPDVVHLHSTFAGAVGRPLLFLLRPMVRPKVVYSPHCWAFIATENSLARWITGKIEGLLSRLTDAIVCESHFEADAATPCRLSCPITLIPSAAEPPMPTDTTGPRLRTDGRIEFLFVGRYDQQKGFDLFVEAAEALDSASHHFRAVGGFVREADREPGADGTIEYVPWQDRAGLATLYTSSSAVVMPSRWESFGLVAVEAMSYGIPVIASDSCSLPEIVEPGKNGWLFRSGDGHALIEILNRLTFEDLKRASVECIDSYEQRYRSDKMAEKYFEMYSTILSA